MLQTFPRPLKEQLIQQIRDYMQNELEIELGGFEAEFFLDHLMATLGPHFYNQAIRDVQVHLSGHLDTLNDRIDELQQPLPPI